MKVSILAILFALTGAPLVDCGQSNAKPNSAQHREVAVTFDDLPVVSSRNDITTWKTITEDLLKTFTAYKIPVVGFVNEGKLLVQNKRDQARVQLLRRWVDAGLELGNHTFSHLSLYNTPLEDFQNDLIRGEDVTRELLAEKRKKLRYFRHPFLNTGRSLEAKKQFETFLTARGYTVAPVSIDNSDWIFARAYDRARDAKQPAEMKQVADAYILYMEQKVDYWERQSAALFGREIKQVLLLHANAINAEHFGEIVRMLNGRGYKFITLEEALKDTAYASEDKLIGAAGISWIHRWAITRGVAKDFFKGEPATPSFVMKLAGVTSE